MSVCACKDDDTVASSADHAGSTRTRRSRRKCNVKQNDLFEESSDDDTDGGTHMVMSVDAMNGTVITQVVDVDFNPHGDECEWEISDAAGRINRYESE